MWISINIFLWSTKRVELCVSIDFENAGDYTDLKARDKIEEHLVEDRGKSGQHILLD